jgi:MFS family permease
MNVGPDQAGYLIAFAGAVGGIALGIAVGPAAQRFGDRAVAVAGFSLSIVAYALLGFAHTISTFAAVLVIWAIGASCIEPTVSALLANAVPKENRGAVLGFNDLLNNAALMLAPSLGGFIVDTNVALIGVVPGIAVLAGLSFALHLPRDAN